ncbi:Nitrogen assimilation transcription factor nirA [Lachnellula cervina]|uniref:Nitrogen assimilation transcription factor nirA n=1 Tax=Lachnellula cervina TaxID=1316786 RepID=A0A7D8USE5_9HELO|nr:Nitrogen assimilation transcription factor nirA [Lachnellula cervina]
MGTLVNEANDVRIVAHLIGRVFIGSMTVARGTHLGVSGRNILLKPDIRSTSKAYIQTLQDRIAALEQSRTSTKPFLGNGVHSGQLNLDSVRPSNKQLVLENIVPTLDEDAGLQCHSVGHNRALNRVPLNTESLTKDFGLGKPKSQRRFSNGNLNKDENGQLHYFGYSSNLQIVSFLPASPLSSTTAELPSDTTEAETKQLSDSQEMKDHLISLYFTYQHPALPILDEETFHANYRKESKSQYYSPFLLYSILLRALRLSDRKGATGLGVVFLKRAKAELLDELENPTVATIQALCIFGHYLGSLGNDRSCWLYPGMAFRLIYDLGLHQDCSDLLKDGSITQNDRKVRHATLWACYIIDKLYSCFQGRPTSIKLDDISVPLPSKQTVGTQFQILAAWVDLARVLDDIINVINRDDELLDDPTTISKLSVTSDKLLRWLKELPTELQWNAKQAPLSPSAIFALHMQFLTTTILLHRPFSASVLNSGTGKSSTRHLKGYTSSDSQKICTLNSIRVVKMLNQFQQQFGLRRIFSWSAPIALTVSLSLLSDIASGAQDEDKSNVRNWLQLCIKIQEDMSLSLLLAGRNLAILRSMLEHCRNPQLSRLIAREILRDPPPAVPPAAQYQEPFQEAGHSAVVQETPGVALGGTPDLGILDQMEVDPAMGPHDFDFSDFFPQFMPLGFGNWTSEVNPALEANVGSGCIQSFGQQNGAPLGGAMTDYSMDLQFS